MPKSHTSEEIRIPPIPKETAGAVTGAAIGSVAGPIGAVVGGVVGALAGKASASGKPILPAARKTVFRVVKKTKTVAKTAKRATQSRGKAKKSSRRTSSRGKTVTRAKRSKSTSRRRRR
jgi:hypothetical protein